MAAELRALEELLKDRIGLDPSSVGPQLLLRAARQRMRDLKLDDLAAYERQVRQSATELDELIEEVIVAESWFFRDVCPFEWLRDHLCQKWKSAPARPPLRILSLPCAGGEEPYSIAIMLSEAELPVRRYHIDAVDISTRRLAIARRGVYSQNAFRGPDAPYRSRYFRQHTDGYEIDPALRATVRFIQGCILDPRLLEGSSPYDVVFCRNLLIYLVPSARTTLLALIDRVLTPEGILFIGHADRLDSTGAESGFASTGDLGCFAYRRIARGESPVPRVLHSLESPPPILSLLAPRAVPAIETSSPAEVATDSIQPALPTFAENLAPRAVEPPALLSQASELANQGRFRDAIAVCERHLREKGLTAPTYSLMGMICQAAGDRGRAEDCLRKAVYLDPNHDEALLALALLAERRGDQNAAIAFRRRAERTAALSRKRVN
jgi:chemotaxis protein methyltransferase WspC